MQYLVHGASIPKSVADVLDTRLEQEHQGYNASHDDLHTDGSLALLAERMISVTGPIDRANWTHAERSRLIKKHDGDNRRFLVIAAALLIAEIERLDRIAE